MKADKLIISNRTALQFKYKKAFSSIKAELDRLVKFDKSRGLTSVICYVDEASTMKKVDGHFVNDPKDAKAVKRAIDELYRSYQPDYLLIFGASDIVPLVHLSNQLYDPPEGDDDERVESDLPYCCDKPYSQDPGKFFSPTRVLGRLPDVVGIADPSIFQKLVSNIVKYKPGSAKDFGNYFGLSVWDWRVSTEMSLQNISGDNKALHTSPVNGPKFTKDQLKPKLHFINCHGGLNDTSLYGQKGKNTYPVALTTGALKGKITYGSVVAAECCYGGQLFQPGSINELPFCNTYLVEGALAFVGSTSTAYGPPDDQGLADLITQYFLLNVLEGASTGRAFLQAQQKFLEVSRPHIDPYEVKTISEFCLLGDPSLVLVHNPKIFSKKNKETVKKLMAEGQRKNRRMELEAKGIELGSILRLPKKVKPDNTSSEIKKVFKSLQMSESKTTTFESGKSIITPGKAFGGKVTFHIATRKRALPDDRGSLHPIQVVLVKEINGTLVDVKEYAAK